MARLGIVSALVLSFFAWNPQQLLAGYVFMKNGYIIQGKVVEKDDEKIVLRWTNGSMAIEHRFIEELVLDGAEEKDLRERAAVDSMTPSTGEFPGIPEENVSLELPPNLEEIIAIHDSQIPGKGTTLPAGAPSATGVTGNEKGTAAGSETPGVGVIPSPAGSGDPREVVCSEAGIALTAPEFWSVEQGPGVVRVVRGDAEHRSALVIHFQNAPGIGLDTMGVELRNALATNYPGARILQERQEEIGNEPAVVIEGDFAARETVFSHAAAQHGGRCYLFTIVLPTPLNTTDQKAIEDCLLSLRFVD